MGRGKAAINCAGGAELESLWTTSRSAADSAQCYLASGIMCVASFLNPRFFESSGRNPNKKVRISSVQGRSIRSSKPLARHGGDESACVARRRHKEAFELEGQ